MQRPENGATQKQVEGSVTLKGWEGPRPGKRSLADTPLGFTSVHTDLGLDWMGDSFSLGIRSIFHHRGPGSSERVLTNV